MSAELANCPFCGSQPNWCMCDDEGCHRIECACGFQLDTLNDDAKQAETIGELRALMAKMWNARTA